MDFRMAYRTLFSPCHAEPFPQLHHELVSGFPVSPVYHIGFIEGFFRLGRECGCRFQELPVPCCLGLQLLQGLLFCLNASPVGAYAAQYRLCSCHGFLPFPYILSGLFYLFRLHHGLCVLGLPYGFLQGLQFPGGGFHPCGFVRVCLHGSFKCGTGLLLGCLQGCYAFLLPGDVAQILRYRLYGPEHGRALLLRSELPCDGAQFLLHPRKRGAVISDTGAQDRELLLPFFPCGFRLPDVSAGGRDFVKCSHQAVNKCDPGVAGFYLLVNLPYFPGAS